MGTTNAGMGEVGETFRSFPPIGHKPNALGWHWGSGLTGLEHRQCGQKSPGGLSSHVTSSSKHSHGPGMATCGVQYNTVQCSKSLRCSAGQPGMVPMQWTAEAGRIPTSTRNPAGCKRQTKLYDTLCQIWHSACQGGVNVTFGMHFLLTPPPPPPPTRMPV